MDKDNQNEVKVKNFFKKKKFEKILNYLNLDELDEQFNLNNQEINKVSNNQESNKDSYYDNKISKYVFI
ncbi:7732_t:CDS:2 [Gigaspora margarita]|uniref:7732_t:CDS:1 n=1 Tax=Gigaspora margarita TaxID=4874 RepID=A0ABN7UQT4_GIGMA|nr:7732_t:CDS:2 [Gigaspora margarita]